MDEKVSELNLSLEEMQSVLAVMVGESDRGAVLLGASILEWQLGRSLERKFLQFHNEPNDKLKGQIRVALDPLSEKSILSTAAARARMCRLLGIIPEEGHEVFKSFFQFRNTHFAHSRKSTTLDDPKIKGELDRLVKMMPRGAEGVLNDNQNGRIRFVYVVSGLYFLLEQHFHDPEAESDEEGIHFPDEEPSD